MNDDSVIKCHGDGLDFGLVCWRHWPRFRHFFWPVCHGIITLAEVPPFQERPSCSRPCSIAAKSLDDLAIKDMTSDSLQSRIGFPPGDLYKVWWKPILTSKNSVKTLIF